MPLIIFDWDGTLMDSVPRIVSCMQKTARAAKLTPPSPAAVHDVIGLSLPVALAQLFPEQRTETEQERLTSLYRYYYVEEDTTPTPLFDGVEHMLSDLKQRGARLAVATGKARRGLDRVWQETNTGHFFSSSYCACEAESKPHPEMLQRILAEQQETPENSVMIGDSKFDLRMAAAAQIASVGVTYGVHGREVLAAESPRYIAASPRALHTWLVKTYFHATVKD
ncbi:HAD family hydrolase [Aliidiomarina taiwanensis]|uniref:HAD family hydrolase n=1 Tax=Aliidiomarina taiwanensis TaxID=946228 RepID=A0A432X9E0_9GAMM|nr:HAD hydrolase-like protein [Aliidiomarina taiwanensis]RUO44045.1 HAD family hydrolase [Aliidiomarina taiwanensis]